MTAHHDTTDANPYSDIPFRTQYVVAMLRRAPRIGPVTARALRGYFLGIALETGDPPCK